ncbi:argininosuccinate lyase [Blastocladiella britannica]|nr:argininosuccinate lyase [Blastocladiella britannica]
MASKSKLWGGRFKGDTDSRMHAFNASISYDKRMFEVDLTGSQAYARALLQVGLLTELECEKLVGGLELVRTEWANEDFAIAETDEDIHTANERRLAELIGPEIAGKLHTGRSRNDQVATDMRLWVRSALGDVRSALASLISAMASRAGDEMDVLLPGYTHLQRAQPVRWSHWLMSHAYAFVADVERIDGVAARTNRLPLGSGALAGNPFNVDREFLAQELGFDGVIKNSLHGVGDRDFVAEFLFAATMVMNHMSRISEDLIIYSSAEFGFVKLADAYSTGSSLMPQKKNPDSLELLRGKSGRVFGGLAGFLMTYKGLPSTYNKDLQEDKEAMFDAYDTLMMAVPILQAVVGTLTINKEAMRRALTADVLATDLADYLVRKGVPFRATHHIAGAAVALAEDRGSDLSQLTLADLKGLHPKFEADVAELFNFEASVDRRTSVGGTARERVQEQVDEVQALVAGWLI